MGRPEYGQIRRQQRAVGQFAGETATWRRYVSASAGTPAYGLGDEPQFFHTTITGLFKPMTFEEVGAGGGVYEAGDMKATLIDARPTGRDEIYWRGVAYRVASDPVPMRLVGYEAYHMVLRRGDSTAR